MTVSTESKLALAAVATVLAVSAFTAGGDTTAPDASGPAGWSAPPVRPAAASNLQDMLDLYALKRQLAALRREQPATSAASSGFHDCARFPRGRTPRVG